MTNTRERTIAKRKTKHSWWEKHCVDGIHWKFFFLVVCSSMTSNRASWSQYHLNTRESIDGRSSSHTRKDTSRDRTRKFAVSRLPCGWYRDRSSTHGIFDCRGRICVDASERLLSDPWFGEGDRRRRVEMDLKKRNRHACEGTVEKKRMFVIISCLSFFSISIQLADPCFNRTNHLPSKYHQDSNERCQTTLLFWLAEVSLKEKNKRQENHRRSSFWTESALEYFDRWYSFLCYRSRSSVLLDLIRMVRIIRWKTASICFVSHP